MTPNNKLTIVNGTLADTLKEIDSDTILHADEIQKLIPLHPRELGYNWQWTADFALYTLEKKEPVLYLARLPENLIFQNIEEAIKQIIATGDYRPNTNDAERVINAETTLRIPLSDAGFSIYQSEYNSLNPTQRAFAERIHGTGDSFVAAMTLYSRWGINLIGFDTLSPEYVKEHAKEGPIARLCCSHNHEIVSSFSAEENGVDNSTGSLVGKLKTIADPLEEVFANMRL